MSFPIRFARAEGRVKSFDRTAAQLARPAREEAAAVVSGSPLAGASAERPVQGRVAEAKVSTRHPRNSG